jgi:hypothetical protein
MSIHYYHELEIALDGEVYQCSGELEYEYNPGDRGDWGSAPISAHASDIKVLTLDEVTMDADNEDGYIWVEPSSELAEKLCKYIVDTYEEDDSELVDEWETDAMELAASNRYDEYVERMHDEY